jgi:copper chaperone CopZ
MPKYAIEFLDSDASSHAQLDALLTSQLWAQAVAWTTASVAEVTVPNGRTLHDLVEALELSGHDAREYFPRVTLTVTGMMCQKNCGTTVANALLAVPGVKSATVSFDKSSAAVRGHADVAALISAIEDVGFEAGLAPAQEAVAPLPAQTLGRRDPARTAPPAPHSPAYGPEDEDERATLIPKRAGGDAAGPKADESVELAVQGMSCAACVSNIELGLADLSGVKTARVALISEKVGRLASGRLLR